MKIISLTKYSFIVIISLVMTLSVLTSVYAAEESGSVGLEGKISAPAPSRAATITFPRNGQTITELPVEVTGLCPDDVTVRIYKNNVFAGAAPCENGSYSVRIDLFAGSNELVARVYDDLNQRGPDSNKVVVTFPVEDSSAGDRISLTSPFARRGTNPGEGLTWPLTLSGGDGPYAITADWGDSKEEDVISQGVPGNFNIEHVYDTPGIYTVVIKAIDVNDEVAFLQVVGVSNGNVGQGGQADDSGLGRTFTKILWEPALIVIPLLLSSFWLGKKHELHVLRKRLESK
ncbi:MAG TPA: hypothetical protein VFX79_02080 [Candidatus Saccharimonadales bacterium]|nr:hypothetical protein [Candidatus Saccharimonadales bacterium]